MPSKTKTKPKKKPVKLTVAQIKIVGQFSDYSFENRKPTFEQTVQKQLKRPFPRTPQGRQFETECREVFDRERGK